MPGQRPHTHRSSSARHGEDQAFTLDELTSAADVTVRTVRYYIAEGLLPPPIGGGPGSRYTSEHLDRLRLIGRMKDAYLPLREIRRRLQAMNEDEIHAAARELQGSDTAYPLPPDAIGATPPLMAAMPDQDRLWVNAKAAGPDNAADYIARIQQHEESPPQRFMLREDRSPIYDRPTDRDIEPATWRRLRIGPEAELMITEETYQRRREQIDALITWAQRILNGT